MVAEEKLKPEAARPRAFLCSVVILDGIWLRRAKWEVAVNDDNPGADYRQSFGERRPWRVLSFWLAQGKPRGVTMLTGSATVNCLQSRSKPQACSSVQLANLPAQTVTYFSSSCFSLCLSCVLVNRLICGPSSFAVSLKWCYAVFVVCSLISHFLICTRSIWQTAATSMERPWKYIFSMRFHVCWCMFYIAH